MKFKRQEDLEIASIYDHYARYIDALFGRWTENFSHRKRAVAAMNLTPNSTVLDIGCGIGSNFKTIQRYLSGEGMIVGIDVSSESLKLARKHILRHNWRNVCLVNESISDYHSNIRYDAAICTFALEIMNNYERAIDNVYDLLKPNGSFVIIGMKLTSRLPFAWSNLLVDEVWKRAKVDSSRDVRAYIKSKAWKIEFQEECLFGFYYIILARRA